MDKQSVEKFQEIITKQCDEISTLKEKAEVYDRLTSKEPCEFCVNNSTKELEHNGFKMTCYSTHYGYAELQVESPEHDGTGDFEINYCPMCGRNLGGEEWKKIYDYALNHQFRFLSYGDSSLLVP